MTSLPRLLPAAASLALLLSVTLPAQAVFLATDKPAPASVDLRPGVLQPAAAQLAAVSALGGHATWNRFGTVHSLVRHGGYLATGLAGTPVEAARTFIKTHRDLFKLSAAAVDQLELVNDGITPGSAGHAVLFRQRFGGMRVSHDGLITVGIVGGKVYYVSSSSAGDQPLPAAPRLTAGQAWLAAAADVNRRVSPSAIRSITDTVQGKGWNLLRVAGFADVQRARLVAMPMPLGGVVPAYETIVLDSVAGVPMAYVHFIDARSGAVLRRENRLYNQSAGAAPAPFSGSLPDDGSCAERAEFDVAAGNASISVVATAINLGNDININLYTGGKLVATTDLLTSPEALNYAPSGGVAAGTYQVEICSFDGAAPLPPTDFAGVFTASTTAAPGTGSLLPYPPKWSWFAGTPTQDYSDTDNRVLGCWQNTVNGSPVAGCGLELNNIAARAPWDIIPALGLPSFTTIGNAAVTAQAWLSPLTPAENIRPVSTTREYVYPFTNVWHNSQCSPTNLVPGGNDIDAVVAHLFATHNRMHDWSYFLGWTERNYNMQLDNFGLTDPTVANDPEIGNAQAGAITGAPGTPTFALLTGRDNANQIALQDGVPGITNQYLFQPIGGVIYAPCADGDLDMGIVGHEYTHATSNRMIGGPDQSIGGHQGGAMGESWSDLAATEYQLEYGFLPQAGTDDTALGSYATGNKQRGIRNFALENNPLNYSNVGYDTPGPQVHADGEIWNGVQWQLRKAFIDEYNGRFPVSDVARQKDCADGRFLADACPGNRRWIQLMYDSFLLMPAAPSMLDARDAMLAADMARFGGANQKLMWKVFAQRGMGEDAYSVDGEDTAPVAHFGSPLESAQTTLRFAARAGDESNAAITNAKLYVGQFSMRSRPIADTDPATVIDTTSDITRLATQNLGDTATLVPGTYDFIVVAPGYGIHRFSRVLSAGTFDFTVTLPTNWASLSKTASVVTTATDEANIALKDTVIDDSEDTGARIGDNGLVAGAYAIVKLAGGSHRISSVNVSTAAGPNNPGRFTALRAFELLACSGSCDTPDAFTKVIYTSPADAFPSFLIRPVQNDLFIKSFSFAPVDATHLMLKVVSSQCTGNPLFAGEQDADPLNDTDCATAAALTDPTDPTQLITPPPAPGSVVRLTDLQVFSAAPSATGTPPASGGGGGGGSDGGASTGGGGGGAVGGVTLLSLMLAGLLRRRRAAGAR